jgi:hypothetical protein
MFVIILANSALSRVLGGIFIARMTGQCRCWGEVGPFGANITEGECAGQDTEQPLQF